MKANITKKAILLVTLLALALGLVACSGEVSDGNEDYQTGIYELNEEEMATIETVLKSEEESKAASIVTEAAKISVGRDSDELVNTHYEDVVSILKNAGFSHIETSAETIEPDASTDGMCISITINGIEEFGASDKFNPEDSVVVYYGVGQRAKVPAVWTDLLERHYEEVEKMFVEAGFTNVTSQAHEIDYNENSVFEGSVVNISIDGNAVYEADTEFLANVKVHIDYRVKPVVVPELNPEATTEPTPAPAPDPQPEKPSTNTETPSGNTQTMVWIPQSGSKYHSRSGCSNMKNPTKVTLDEAQSLGYTACKRCH